MRECWVNVYRPEVPLLRSYTHRTRDSAIRSGSRALYRVHIILKDKPHA